MKYKRQTLLEFAIKLIKHKSITPEDDGAISYIGNILHDLDFNCELIEKNGVKNLLASKIVSENFKTLLLAGHIDVVPPGNLSFWKNDPFEGKVIDDYLYGRGSSDMKSAIAAMIFALKEFHADKSNHLNLVFIITSDEEGPAIYGTKLVCEILKKRNMKIDFCVIGEPTSSEVAGDFIKLSRRGSISGSIKVFGEQGHCAYPQNLINPIHKILLPIHNVILEENSNEQKFNNSFQIFKILSDDFAENITPSLVTLSFNYRFEDLKDIDELKERIISKIDTIGIRKYVLKFSSNFSEPFISKKSYLFETAKRAIYKETGKITKVSRYSGGTSDGRFIRKICEQIVEIGATNNTIHKENECISIKNLFRLKNIYRNIITMLSRDASDRIY